MRSRLRGRPVLHPALEQQRHLDQQLLAGLSKHRLPTWSQLKMLPKLITPAERRQSIVLLFLLLISVSFLLIRSWWSSSNIGPATGGSYVEALVGAPQYINPLLSVANDVDRDVSGLVFCGLMRLDANGQVVPDAAESVDVSADGLTYTVNLKPNVTWHDGAPVTIDDVVFTITSLQDDTFGSPLSSLWSDVEIVSQDDHSIKLHLAQPNPDFKETLTQGLLPVHAWGDIPAANLKLTSLNVKPIGCGPFAFSNFTRDSRGNFRTLTLHRYSAYHGQKPYLDEIVFKFYSDYETAVAALTNGNVEGLGSLPSSFVKDVSGKRNINIYRMNIPQYTAAFYNLRTNVLLRQKEVRQALDLAVDKQKIVDQAVNGQATIIDSPVLTVGDNNVRKTGDIEGAKQILIKAGWKLTDGKWQKDKQILAVKILASDSPEHKVIAGQLKNDWEALGVSISVEIIDRNDLRDRVRDGSYEVLIFSESLGITNNPFAFWHSSQAAVGGLNLSGWSNRDADALLEKIRSTADNNQRQGFLVSFQNLVRQEIPATFLYNPTFLYPVNSIVHGIRADKIGVPADRFSGVSGWYINTMRTL